MDNGLIFPYRLGDAPAEACDAKDASWAQRVFLVRGSGESPIRTRIRQATEGRRKVAHPGRWLSRGKRVGRGGENTAFKSEA